MTNRENTREQRRWFRDGRYKFLLWQQNQAFRASQRNIPAMTTADDSYAPLTDFVASTTHIQARKGWGSRMLKAAERLFNRGR